MVTELLEAGALIAGSPTINNNMFPTVADILSYVQGLKPRNLLGFASGSYGWSGEFIKQVEKYLIDMGVEITISLVKQSIYPIPRY